MQSAIVRLGRMKRLTRAVRARWMERTSRRSMLQALLSIAMVLGAAWLIVMGGADEADADVANAPRVGQEAPDFTVETLTAGPFILSAARGRPVWISFWATWCPPCRAELPDIEVVRAGAGDRLGFIAVDLDEPRSAITSFMSEAGYDFPAGVDPEGEVSRRYRVVGLPTHVFVAADGTIAEIRVGGMSRSAMSETVSALLAGKAPSESGRADLSASAVEVRLGAAVYAAQCLRCHGGPDGTGGIPAAPPHTGEGHTWHHSDLHLTGVIMRGGGDRQAMPAFGDRLKPDEVRAILAYLKTWWSDGQREFQAQVTKENDRGRS